MPRSYLYVPGNAQDKLNRVSQRGGDALIVDLEDSVPWDAKVAAREAVAHWLSARTVRGEVWVRINEGETGVDDLTELAGHPGLAGLVLPKIEGPDDVSRVVEHLRQLGHGATRLMPMIETARAVLTAAAIAVQPGVETLQLGEVDLASELGLSPGDDESELLAVRTSVVLACAAARIRPPLGPVSRIIHDVARLDSSSRRLKRMGFVGRACIHPAQVPVVHAVFTPSAEELLTAREVLNTLAQARSQGMTVVLDAAGNLLDPAVVRGAEKTLAMARWSRP